jgi:hypothetical protein
MEKIESIDWQKECNAMIEQGFVLIMEDDKVWWVR